MLHDAFAEAAAFEFTSDVFPRSPELLDGVGGLPLGVHLTPMAAVDELPARRLSFFHLCLPTK